jgi:hypothetical protein
MIFTFLGNSGWIEQFPELLHVESGSISGSIWFEGLIPETFPELQQVVDKQRNVLQAALLIRRHRPKLTWNPIKKHSSKALLKTGSYFFYF